MKLADMSYTILDEQLIIHILNNLPEEYDIQVSKLESQLNNKNNLLSIGDIQTELSLRYARIKNKNGSSNKKESGTEQAFAAFHWFKGKCNKCGRIGHKAADCRSGGASGARCNNSNNNVREGHGGGANGDANHKHLRKENRCFYCKKQGHIAKNCYLKKQGNNN